jgi:MoaA/NifB/PqqE/SkfB family radical SAM enzyme
MNKIISIEPAIDPSNRPTFLLDWELTMKCNLDCSYCPTGIEFGSHDNSTNHPPLAECLQTIDFMFAYADKYMQLKPKWQRTVILNVYGGESIFHPDIVEIFEQVRARHTYDWNLTVTCTTNAVAGVNLWQRVSELIDEFTISFHSESLPKQRQQIFDNLLYNKSVGRKQKVVFVMHNNPEMWAISCEGIEFCKQHGINYIVKANDSPDPKWRYNQEQVVFFKEYYNSRTTKRSQPIVSNALADAEGTMGDIGRSCCGGRSLCSNQDLKHPVAFVPANDFRDWYCSVNWYFLYIKQLTGDVYTNKDCRMNFDGTVSPLGNIKYYKTILDNQQKMLDSERVPVIQCAKDRCICGYCAPKAQNGKDFVEIMQKHVDKKIKFAYNTCLDDK